MHEVLTTDRLTLRPLETTDAKDFARLVNNPDICRMTGTFPYPFPECSAEGRVQIFCSQAATGYSYHWAMIWQDQFVGVIGLFGNPETREIGYWLGEPFWGKGLMREAIAGLMNYLMELNPNLRMVAGVFTDNPASAHLLKRLGFEQETDLSEGYSLARGEKHDLWKFQFEATSGDRDTSVIPLPYRDGKKQANV
ncbi:MAG: GNAT family N-acetyltransferase [Litorimonas sp.]